MRSLCEAWDPGFTFSGWLALELFSARGCTVIVHLLPLLVLPPFLFWLHRHYGTNQEKAHRPKDVFTRRIFTELPRRGEAVEKVVVGLPAGPKRLPNGSKTLRKRGSQPLNGGQKKARRSFSTGCFLCETAGWRIPIVRRHLPVAASRRT